MATAHATSLIRTGLPYLRISLASVPAVGEHVPEPEPQPLFQYKHVDADDGEFKQPGGQRRDGRALYAERGRAEIPENQNPVEKYVRCQRREIYNHRDFYNLNRAQAADKGVAETEGEVGVAENAKVFRAVLDDRTVGGIQAHYLLGYEQRGKSQHKRDDDNRFKDDGEYDADAGIVLLPIVLRAEYGSRAGKSETGDGQYKKRLVGKRRGGQQRFPAGRKAEHNGVGQLDDKGDEVLQGDGQSDRHRAAQ